MDFHIDNIRGSSIFVGAELQRRTSTLENCPIEAWANVDADGLYGERKEFEAEHERQLIRYWEGDRWRMVMLNGQLSWDECSC
jgi:hypothetical protein